MKDIELSGGLRTEVELKEGASNVKIFDKFPLSTEKKLENFPIFVRRQNLTRFLVLYELFKLSLPVKGSIIECGVNFGFGLMSWAKLSSILEPVNLNRCVFGFDTFSGFANVSDKDQNELTGNVKQGGLAADVEQELNELIEVFDSTRFIGHIPKVRTICGDAQDTIPKFVLENQHLIVSLLFLDFDLYGPTKVALENFLPRMPKGAIIAFDELNNPLWPGETLAMLEAQNGFKFELRRFDFDPYVSYAVLT